MDYICNHRILLAVSFWLYFYDKNVVHPLFSVHQLLFLGLQPWFGKLALSGH